MRPELSTRTRVLWSSSRQVALIICLQADTRQQLDLRARVSGDHGWEEDHQRQGSIRRQDIEQREREGALNGLSIRIQQGHLRRKVLDHILSIVMDQLQDTTSPGPPWGSIRSV